MEKIIVLRVIEVHEGKHSAQAAFHPLFHLSKIDRKWQGGGPAMTLSIVNKCQCVQAEFRVLFFATGKVRQRCKGLRFGAILDVGVVRGNLCAIVADNVLDDGRRNAGVFHQTGGGVA